MAFTPSIPISTLKYPSIGPDHDINVADGDRPFMTITLREWGMREIMSIERVPGY